MVISVTGKRGSWFADAGKERLPCVHEEWFRPKNTENPYPYYLDEGAKLGDPRWDEFIEGIKQKKRVVITKDRWSEETGNFERIGYKAVWDIDNITVDIRGLRFDFIKRIDDAQ